MIRCKRSVKKLSGNEDSLKDMLSVLDDSLERAAMETDSPEMDLPAYEEIGNPETTDSMQSYSSPTLLNLPSKLLPKEEFTCMFCPAAMWLTKGEALVCFCRMMKSVSFTSAEEDATPVFLCDGPFLVDAEAK